MEVLVFNIVLGAKLLFLLAIVEGFSFSGRLQDEDQNMAMSEKIGKHLFQEGFPIQSGLGNELSRETSKMLSNRLSDSIRKKRDLAGSTNPFGRNTYRWKLKPGKPTATSTGVADPTKNGNENLSYNYQFWGENFALKGNVTVVQYGRKLRILFLYTIKGFANATMDLVRQNVKNTFGKWPVASGASQKPRSCRFQRSENTSLFVRNPIKCSQPLKKGFTVQNQLPLEAMAAPLMLGDKNPAIDTEPDFPTQRNSPQTASDCNIPVTSFKKTWLCIDPDYPPCFLLTVQDDNYKVTETICPKQMPNRNGPTQKLFSGYW
uniref:Uncharacterized protein LOC108950221 n=1 Tax=Phallusia mammillata TaxID=59560 RepID=A0A6F9DK18_9ASCI|nr:uncharacterized protein LOC108950221 [Phallusia mammillata]